MTVEEFVIRESESGGFPRKLKALRALRGYSQEQLAGEVGLDRSTISLLETGKQKPYKSTIERLARALNVPADILES